MSASAKQDLLVGILVCEYANELHEAIHQEHVNLIWSLAKFEKLQLLLMNFLQTRPASEVHTLTSQDVANAYWAFGKPDVRGWSFMG